MGLAPILGLKPSFVLCLGLALDIAVVLSPTTIMALLDRTRPLALTWIWTLTLILAFALASASDMAPALALISAWAFAFLSILALTFSGALILTPQSLPVPLLPAHSHTLRARDLAATRPIARVPCSLNSPVSMTKS